MNTQADVDTGRREALKFSVYSFVDEYLRFFSNAALKAGCIFEIGSLDELLYSRK